MPVPVRFRNQDTFEEVTRTRYNGKITRAYKICEIDSRGNLLTLFHGVNGSRVLPRDQWLRAENKIVNDGGATEYISGFHVFLKKKDAEEYIKKFKKERLLTIKTVGVKDIYTKAHSTSPVYLADFIKLHVN